MASTRDLEDTLPLTSPLTQNPGFEDRKIAIYTTLLLEPSQLRRLEEDLRNADDILSTDVARLAPQPHFSSVFDIYNHHIDLAEAQGDSSQHDPSYFIVADQENWNEKGLLFVNVVAVTEPPPPPPADTESCSSIGPPRPTNTPLNSVSLPALSLSLLLVRLVARRAGARVFGSAFGPGLRAQLVLWSRASWAHGLPTAVYRTSRGENFAAI